MQGELRFCLEKVGQKTQIWKATKIRLDIFNIVFSMYHIRMKEMWSHCQREFKQFAILDFHMVSLGRAISYLLTGLYCVASALFAVQRALDWVDLRHVASSLSRSMPGRCPLSSCGTGISSNLRMRPEWVWKLKMLFYWLQSRNLALFKSCALSKCGISCDIVCWHSLRWLQDVFVLQEMVHRRQMLPGRWCRARLAVYGAQMRE